MVFSSHSQKVGKSQQWKSKNTGVLSGANDIRTTISWTVEYICLAAGR